MGNMSGMFSFAVWVIRALKCETVNFIKFDSAGIPVRLFRLLNVPMLIISHVPCSRVCNAHAKHDVIRFTYDAHHVTMTSPAFAFHSCHMEVRWHDVISVLCCRNTMSSWLTSHGDEIGMTSSYSHHVCIMLMMSSRLDPEIIATHVIHGCSHGA